MSRGNRAALTLAAPKEASMALSDHGKYSGVVDIARNGMDILGAYVYHTHTRPIILLDPALIKANAATNNLNFANEVAITLAHEIAHAYQDRIGVLDETEDVEAAAETFAKIWLDRGEVCVDILTPRPIDFFSKPPF
jgi:hypothetical protein